MNDDGTLERVLADIYPSEMVINKTNISVAKVSYLDLSISVLYRGKFLIKLFDKRKDYSFNVINYPFMDGTIPKAPTYGVFVSQLTRFCRVNNTLKGFLEDAGNLVRKLVSQSFDVAALRNKFQTFMNRQYMLWGKFGSEIYFEDIYTS